ncbi:MAG TPA: tRNA (adenosine(37)-N6)-threonylcarbamoyltransferase complex dimerization subunit type 1 TsaB [Edaphocola sp.]|nr:tRNA (adenosine(37)-N6)-threonylcarbamoyltransferase complex dimerization subunit type 1 TsaB [Edaphocola sp.]
MPNFLFIDTSAQTATIAVASKGAVSFFERLSHQKEQVSAINIMIENVLKKAGMALRDIDVVGVCAGPGSYTGLRVGMSIAKGMAFALQKPLICFNRLQLIALSYKDSFSNPADIAVFLKARKGEYFRALYAPDGSVREPAGHIFEEAIGEKIKPQQVIITDSPELSCEQKKIILPAAFSPDLKAWLALAENLFEEKKFADLAYAEPFYLKAAFTTTPKSKI